ncbi:MAG: Lipid A export ATP-binding/permease protein MsbA [Phycisphaerales bacterium]|nr:Lipid A export ATP-binding/permease protein MsbA [Phycisphaerales bacterium]
MLRYRSLVVWTIVTAFLAAGSLGVGLVAIAPILKSLLGEGGAEDLHTLAARANAGGGLNLYFTQVRIPEWVVDRLPDSQSASLALIMAGLFVLTVFGAFTTFMQQFLSLNIVNRTMTNIRREAFHKVLRRPLKEIVIGGPSDAIARIMQDSAALTGGFQALLSKFLPQLTKGVAAFLAAFVIDWRLAALSLVIGPLLFVIIRKLGKRIRRASKASLVSQSELYHAAAEALQGLRVVKVHSAERYEAGRFHRLNKAVLRENNRVRTARALASPLVEMLTVFAAGTIALIAANNIRVGSIEAEAVIQVFIALGAAGASLKPLTGFANDIQQSSAAAERLSELMRAAPESGHDHRLPKLPRHARSIEFRNVWLTYPGAEKPALRDVNFRIDHGRTVAFVGPNGCGKTTLLSLIPRLFDPDVVDGRRGLVLIDDQDISRFAVRSVRRQVGVVTQETVLFKGTIRSNIAYGAENVTEELMIEAARKSRAHDFIEKLPQGYDTVVGEQGLTLSGGQRQRIAIARAILRDPAILVLDEATSMVDADSEAAINEAIGRFGRERTCLIVAHRLSTVLGADVIVVMDQGQIVDSGRHEDLLERCPTYRLIAQRQMRG